MKIKIRKNGSALLITVFAVAMLAALVMGMLQITTEEIMLMQNNLYAAEATATAEAGLNDAFAQIWDDPNCITTFPFTTPFNGGSYTVSSEGVLPDPNIISEATTAEGFVARVKADITIKDVTPYVIMIDELRTNE
ncbi:MAG: hypothetical protein KAS75_02215 [Planctomycetes bacterium]|nr:hypothetical protein [Planctomycetota bacterium]